MADLSCSVQDSSCPRLREERVHECRMVIILVLTNRGGLRVARLGSSVTTMVSVSVTLHVTLVKDNARPACCTSGTLSHGQQRQRPVLTPYDDAVHRDDVDGNATEPHDKLSTGTTWRSYPGGNNTDLHAQTYSGTDTTPKLFCTHSGVVS